MNMDKLFHHVFSASIGAVAGGAMIFAMIWTGPIAVRDKVITEYETDFLRNAATWGKAAIAVELLPTRTATDTGLVFYEKSTSCTFVGAAHSDGTIRIETETCQRFGQPAHTKNVELTVALSSEAGAITAGKSYLRPDQTYYLQPSSNSFNSLFQ